MANRVRHTSQPILVALLALGFLGQTLDGRVALAAPPATLDRQAPPPQAAPRPAIRPGAEVPGINAFTIVDDHVALGGAVELSAYPLLKQAGFVAVINLRATSEAGAEVEGSMAAAKAAGLRYIHLPVDRSGPEANTVYEFLKAVSDPANQPVLVHCARAVRASVLWSIKRSLQDGWPVEEALGEFPELAKLASEPLKTFVRSYVRAHSRQRQVAPPAAGASVEASSSPAGRRRSAP